MVQLPCLIQKDRIISLNLENGDVAITDPNGTKGNIVEYYDTGKNDKFNFYHLRNEKAFQELVMFLTCITGLRAQRVQLMGRNHIGYQFK